MRSGSAFTQLVTFDTGFPDAAITWALLDGAGTTVTSGTVTPVALSVSAVIAVSGTYNTLSGGALSAPRELSWHYAVAGLQVSGQTRYRVEAFLPYGVSPNGVRAKLGIEQHELPDDLIDLVTAYDRFRTTVSAVKLTAADSALDRTIGDAIEALAATIVIASLQVRISLAQSSGNDTFERFAKIDWDALQASLGLYINAGYLAIDAAIDVTTGYGLLMIPVVRLDPLTGADQNG